jgi:hypothetical protein
MPEGLLNGTTPSGSVQVNGNFLGAIITGSNARFGSIALSASTKSGGGPDNNFLAQGYRATDAELAEGAGSARFLSASFDGFSASFVQVANFLKHKIDQVSTDAEVTYAEVSGALLEAGTALDIGHNAAGHRQNVNVYANLSASGEIAGQSLKIDNATVVTEDGKVQAVTEVSGAGALTGQSLNVDVDITGAGVISGKSLTIANTSLVTEAGALIALTTVSGAGGVSGSNAIFDGHGRFGTFVSGAGGISGQSLVIGQQVVVDGDVNIGSVKNISGSAMISGQALTIDNAIVVTDEGKVQAVTDVSGAGSVLGQLLSVATTVSGAGAIQGQDLVLGNSTVISDTKAIQNVTTISGAGVASAKFFQFEGTDATGDATLFQLEVVGGMLQVTDQGDA